MDEHTVEIDAETAAKLMKLTKRELIEKFCIAAIDARVARDDAAVVRKHLRKAEAYVEQGRTMIEALMEQWYDYND